MNPDLLTRLREPIEHIGTWISGGSPVITEMAAEIGFDWLLIDMEHGFGSEESLFPQLLAVKNTGTAAIVRVGAPHPDLILRVLDRGATGIMVPHIESAEQAEALVQAAHYPPRGCRGYSRSTRSHLYGLNIEPAPPPLIIAQIETIQGVLHAEEIAAVDGIDILFVGPADLGFDLRVRPGQCDLDYFQCLEKTVSAAKKHGRQCGILVRDKNDIPSLREQGFTLLAIDSDMGILRNSYKQLIAEYKS
jgi:2-dehydro-3-deoxyglucarate aldolase/4-hydroxy-2-oxoheptanedioate aldolase